MNNQIRRLYIVIVAMVMSLAMAATYIQFIAAPKMNADGRNSRTILHAAERDRGPIIVGGEAIAKSIPIEGTKRFQRVYTQPELYASVTGWFSSSLRSATGLEAAADTIFEGDSLSLSPPASKTYSPAMLVAAGAWCSPLIRTCSRPLPMRWRAGGARQWRLSLRRGGFWRFILHLLTTRTCWLVPTVVRPWPTRRS